RWHLAPLDRNETAEYVRHRLRIAGGTNATKLFTPGALRALYRYSGGVPRLINIAAHRSLLTGFTRERRIIDARTVRAAMHELQRDERPPERPPRVLWPLVGAALTAVALAFASVLAVVPPPRHLLFPRHAAPSPGADPATAGDPNAASDGSPAGVRVATSDVQPAGATPAPVPTTTAVETANVAATATAQPTADPTTTVVVATPAPTPTPAEVAVAALAPNVAVAPTPLAPAAAVVPVGADAFWATLAASDNRTTALN